MLYFLYIMIMQSKKLKITLIVKKGNDNKGDAFMDIQKKIEEVVNKDQV